MLEIVGGFSQKKLIEYNLDFKDKILLCYILDSFRNITDNCDTLLPRFQEYIEIDYEIVVQTLPIFRTQQEAFARRVRKYVEKGLIKRISSEIVIQHLQAKQLQGLGYGAKRCEWCGISTLVLCNHHHPIPKSQGGTETVGICPNATVA